MASEQQVKRYLAYWFLLGKKVVIPRQNQAICPKMVYNGSFYSSEFEKCWQRIVAPREDSYLEGTGQTIRELLTSRWEISDCANCKMPIPILVLGVQSVDCPCSDLESWPNDELPTPKPPLDHRTQLAKIRQRLARWRDDDE